MDINEACKDDTKKSETNQAIKKPCYYAVFRVALPDDGVSIVETNVREAVVDAVREALLERGKIFDDIDLQYRFELTTDWIEVG